jgi:hypothetical protein
MRKITHGEEGRNKSNINIETLIKTDRTDRLSSLSFQRVI